MRLDILFSAGVAQVCVCVCVFASTRRTRTHGPDFILNVMTLPQALKRHSDRARIPSYCYERRRIEREREREKGNVLAVTSAVESLRDGTRRGAESRRTSY